MAKVKAPGSFDVIPPMRPALTPEARENQMVYLATELAEKQLREGTASAQVICHYLKLATKEEHIKNRLLEKELELKEAKTEMLRSAKRVEELYANAISAMRTYSGHGESEDDN